MRNKTIYEEHLGRRVIRNRFLPEVNKRSG